MFIEYKRTVSWDLTLINIGVNQDGLGTCGQKVTSGPPAVKPNRFIAGAIIQNIVDGHVYQNAGSSASPVWSVLSTDGGSVIQFSCSDLVTDLSTGVDKGFEDVITAGTVISVYAGLKVPQVAGAIFTVDILLNGFSILDTLITIENGEQNCLTATTPPVVKPNVTCVPGDRFTASIIQVGTPFAKGLQVAVQLA